MSREKERERERGKIELIVRVAPDQPASRRTEGASVRIHTHCTNTHCNNAHMHVTINTRTVMSEGEEQHVTE